MSVITLLDVLLIFVFGTASVSAQDSSLFPKVRPVEIQVGKDGASTTFAYYNTTPESPDGKTIAYIRCVVEPTPKKTRVPAALWVCDRNLKQHKKVADIDGISVHDGAEAQWIDNNRIAVFDDMKLRIFDIHSGEDLLRNELVASEIGHETFEGKLLYSICEEKVPGDPAIYELDCNTQQVRTVLSLKDLASLDIPSFMNRDSLYPLLQWQLSHLQYSPDGKKICFRLEMGPKRNILLGICDTDGSNVKTWMKPLHFVWYDNETIVGHISHGPDGKRPEPAERRYSLTRWDLDGKVVQEAITPPGNHLAVSPDGTRFASETFYETNPVVLTLYGPGKVPLEVCRFDPLAITWKKKFHVNPSFSRDGKRLYYSRPVNEEYNGTFFINIE